MVLDVARSLTRRENNWSPSRWARTLWVVVTHIPRQIQILRALWPPVYADLLESDPRFPFRYLVIDYLAKGMTVAERMSCLAHHYRSLHARLGNRVLGQTLYADLTLFESVEEGNLYRIAMSRSRELFREGELSLKLEVNGAVVFVLSLTLVPGSVVRSNASEVLLISRLQGAKGHYRQIRQVTKTLHELGPSALLLAGAQGLAEALGVNEMAGVCAVRQASYLEEFAASYKEAYDGFFSELGVAQNAAGFFVIPIPIVEKPLTVIKQGHKIRTRQKRAFKRQVADDVCRLIQESQ